MSVAAPSIEPVPFRATRATVAIGVVAALLCTLLGRVHWLQTQERDRILDRADRQQHLTERLIARRGSIFDSTGQLLAGTVQTTTLFLDPKEVIDGYELRPGGQSALEQDLHKLGKLIDRDPFELLQLLGEKYPARYVEVAHEVDDLTLTDVRALDMPGVGTTPANQRLYPMGSLAAHLLGGVGTDGKGLEGLELTCDQTMSGVDGAKRSLKDSRRRAIGTEADDYKPAVHGRHLVLTVDANVQLIVEQELYATCTQFGASAGEAVVMDPATGEVVALANYPTFTPQYLTEAKPDHRTNRALVMPYEPGSTIKPLLVAHALDKKAVKLTDVFELGGAKWRTPYGRTISDVHSYDRLAMWDVLVKSSNIGMSQLAGRLGNAELHGALMRFGYGKQTGVDLPGEGTGKVWPLKKWGRASTESIAQGYELLVTPMQMARAMCTIANGGRLVTPRVVRGTLGEDESTIAPLEGHSAPPMFARVIEPETAADLRRVLADTPIRGTAQKARSDVYNVFGKTGTAHRAVGGKYDEKHYTSSFVGGAPYESPRLVVAFVIHDPDRSKAHFGGTVAAPGASRILERSLKYLGVPASPPLPVPPPQVAGLLHNFDAKLYERKASAAQQD